MNDERFAIISYFEARKIVTAESEGRSSLGSRTAAAVVGQRGHLLNCSAAVQGPDLQNILRQSYDYLTIMP